MANRVLNTAGAKLSDTGDGIRNADFNTANDKPIGRVQPAVYYEVEAPKGR